MVVISIILLTIGVGAYLLTQKPNQQQSTSVQQASQQDSMDKDDITSQDSINTRRYVAYTKQALESAASNRRVLYFYANWCPICRPADADLRKNANKIPSDVIVIRVNYNDTDTDQEEKDLAKKYGVTYQHTFVQIDTQENVVTKWNGGQTDELLENIK